MIDLDGAQGEGGGQILRTALSLAGVLSEDVRIFNVRAGRAEPGLRAQHLTAVKAAARLCAAEVSGAQVGSTELVFKPSGTKGGNFEFDVGTAGSITLVLQALLPLLAFARSDVGLEIIGGTDVKWSPPVDYNLHVLLPILKELGLDCELLVERRGHYPKGGGRVRATSKPVGGIRSIVCINRGPVVKIGGVSHAVGLPRHVVERQSDSARKVLLSHGFLEPETLLDYSQASSVGPGSGIVLFAETESGAILGADCLGEKGKPAERVGSESAMTLIEELDSGAGLDRHMGDMVIPFMALAEGFSDVTVSRITQHMLTNVAISEQLTGVKFQVEGGLGAKGRIRVKGLGFTSPSSSSSKETLSAPRP